MSDVANLAVAVALIVAAAVVYLTVRPPRQTRITVMPAELTPADEEAFLADLAAHLTAYGEAVADYYDTTTGD
jgi:hypothetical protein